MGYSVEIEGDTATIFELHSVSSLVMQLLKLDVRCRNSDKWLSYRVYQEIARANGSNVFIPFALFDKLPSFETIARVRRKIQNDRALFLPTDRLVLEKRKIKEEIISEWGVKSD